MYVEVRGRFGVSSSNRPHYHFRHGLWVNPELTNSARLACQQALRMSSDICIYWTIVMNIVGGGNGDLDSKTLDWMSSNFPTEHVYDMLVLYVIENNFKTSGTIFHVRQYNKENTNDNPSTWK